MGNNTYTNSTINHVQKSNLLQYAGRNKPETDLQVLRFAQWYKRGFLSSGYISSKYQDTLTQKCRITSQKTKIPRNRLLM